MQSRINQKDFGSIRHFQHIGHVRGGRDVEDGDVVTVRGENIQYRGAQYSGMNGDRFSRFQPDVDIVALFHFLHEPDQPLAVVEWFGDPVAAAHVEVAELRQAQKMAEFLIHGGKGAFQVVGVLFAKGMKVQTRKTR